MAINAGNSYIPYVADGLDKAHAAPYKDLLQDARAFSEDCPTIGGTGPGSYRFNDGGLLEVMLGGGWVSACPRLGDLVVSDGVFMEMTGTPEIWTPAEKQTKFSQADLDFLGAGSITIPATQGPVDLATAADGDVHFDADGTGKLEIFADGCLKPYPCLSINQCIKLDDGSELVLASKSPEAWAAKSVDAGGTVDAIKADAEALQCLKDAIDTDTISKEMLSISGDVITVTPGNGEPPYDLTITHPPIPPAETLEFALNGEVAPFWNFITGEITYPTINDVTGNAGTPLIDSTTINKIVALIDNSHPDFTVTGSGTIAYDAALDEYTLNFIDTDTRCSFVANADGTITKSAQVFENGQPVGAPVVTTLGTPRQTFVDESGVAHPYDPTTPIKIARNPVVDRFCRDGVDVTTFCDGSEKISWSDNITRQLSFNPTIGTIDSTVAVGTVIAEFEFTLDPGECPRQVTQHSYHSLTGQGVPDNRHVTVRARSSIGGGALTNFATGGEDRLWGNGSTQGEIVYRGTKASQTVAAGGELIRIEFAVERNTLTAADGFFAMGRAAIILSYNQEMCK